MGRWRAMLMLGVLMLGAGVVLTVISLSTPIGGRSVIYLGLIVGGATRIVISLVKRPKPDDVEAQVADAVDLHGDECAQCHEAIPNTARGVVCLNCEKPIHKWCQTLHRPVCKPYV